MAVCRKRSTNSAPVVLSISYFTGAPPSGISMIAWRSLGGLRPGEMCRTSMAASTTLERIPVKRNQPSFAVSFPRKRESSIPRHRQGGLGRPPSRAMTRFVLPFEWTPFLVVEGRRLLQVRIGHDVVLDPQGCPLVLEECLDLRL